MRQKSIMQQKKNYFNELYYKLYKLFVITFKWNKLLGKLIIQKRRPIYYRNICILSNKAKSISRNLRLARNSIRTISNEGFFFGLNKISW